MFNQPMQMDERGIYELRARQQVALSENNATDLFFYMLIEQYEETAVLLRKLRERNDNSLDKITSALSTKLDALKNAIVEHNIFRPEHFKNRHA